MDDRSMDPSMPSTASGKSRSQAATQKDEKNSGQRAKEEHPEAPEPVIGMNDERGGKGKIDS